VNRETIGCYRVVDQIGEGGMAWVYKGVGPDDHQNPTFRGRSFALKLMKPEVASLTEFITRFERETALQIEVEHPSLLTIFDSGKDEESGLFFYTMSYIDGSTPSRGAG
jgi:serine/threonine protein kinase